MRESHMSNKSFNEVGFTYEYRKETEQFYRPFFHTEEEMKRFFWKVFQNDTIDKTPRLMTNQVCRFVSLANDIETIRPGRDPLRILFLRICLESLCSLSRINKSDFFKEFEKCMSIEGTNYISSHFHLTDWAPETEELSNPSCLLSYPGYEEAPISLNDFLLLMKKIRDAVVHEGDYWTMQVFAPEDEFVTLTSFTTDGHLFSDLKINTGKLATYFFSTTLNYQKFIYFFTCACIGFISNYVDLHFEK